VQRFSSASNSLPALHDQEQPFFEPNGTQKKRKRRITADYENNSSRLRCKSASSAVICGYHSMSTSTRLGNQRRTPNSGRRPRFSWSVRSSRGRLYDRKGWQ